MNFVNGFSILIGKPSTLTAGLRMYKAIQTTLIAMLIIGVFVGRGFTMLRAGRDKIMRKSGQDEKRLKLLPVLEKMNSVFYKKGSFKRAKTRKYERGKV